MIKIKNNFLRALSIPAAFVLGSSSFTSVSQSEPTHSFFPQRDPVLVAAYPPSCGATLTDTDKSTSRKNLGTNLGTPNYPVAAQAHHIFPLELFNSPLGTKICGYGINLLEGVENGIWLPTQDYTGRKATIHRGSNSNAYKDTVTTRLNAATNKATALQALSSLKNELANGTLIINNAQ